MAKQGEVKVDAVDNADDLIKKAEQAKEKDNITNVIFYNQDYRTFKNENQYDLIFSNFVLHWAGKYYQDWLQNIYDSLKPGGQFVASISGSIIDKGKRIFTFYELSDGDNSVMQKAIKSLHFGRYFHKKNLHGYWNPTKRELEKALNRIGFKNINVDIKNENCLNQAEYESWDDAYNNILATELNNYNVFLKKEKDRQSLFRECRKLCLELNPKYITAIDLYVTATK
jgi:SAM-dependent methyltransferase